MAIQKKEKKEKKERKKKEKKWRVKEEEGKPKDGDKNKIQTVGNGVGVLEIRTGNCSSGHPYNHFAASLSPKTTKLH